MYNTRSNRGPITKEQIESTVWETFTVGKHVKHQWELLPKSKSIDIRGTSGGPRLQASTSLGVYPSVSVKVAGGIQFEVNKHDTFTMNTTMSIKLTSSLNEKRLYRAIPSINLRVNGYNRCE